MKELSIGYFINFDCKTPECSCIRTIRANKKDSTYYHLVRYCKKYPNCDYGRFEERTKEK